MSQKAIWLQPPLHHARNENDFPSVSMEKPTGDEIFRDGELRKLANIRPCIGTHEKAASRTPGGIGSIAQSIISTGSSGVSLVERIIGGDIVMELSMSAKNHDAERSLQT